MHAPAWRNHITTATCIAQELQSRTFVQILMYHAGGRSHCKAHKASVDSEPSGCCAVTLLYDTHATSILEICTHMAIMLAFVVYHHTDTYLICICQACIICPHLKSKCVRNLMDKLNVLTLHVKALRGSFLYYVPLPLTIPVLVG